MLYILAITLGILRWVPRASALYRWLPSRWQWLPSAIVAAAGVFASRFGWGPDALSMAIPTGVLAIVDASLEAVLGLVLAAQAGAHPPPVVQITVAPLPKVSSLLLFFGILLAGCSPSTTAEPCSADSLRALTGLCVEAIERAKPEDVAAEAAVCRSVVREWQGRCGT